MVLPWVQSLRTQQGITACQNALASTWYSAEELGEMDEQSSESQARIRDDALEEMFGLDDY